MIDAFLFVFLLLYSVLVGVFGESRASAWLSGFTAAGTIASFVNMMIGF
jgi:hypothetical protein